MKSPLSSPEVLKTVRFCDNTQKEVGAGCSQPRTIRFRKREITDLVANIVPWCEKSKFYELKIKTLTLLTPWLQRFYRTFAEKY
jgi:hypothetical protein